MTHDEIRELLTKHQISYDYKEKAWFYGRLKVGSVSNVFNMPMFLEMRKLELDEIQDYMEKESSKPGKSEASLADVAVGLFFDELGMTPENRCYLDKSIPKFVVLDGFKSFPYEEKCPARKCNEAKLRMYFSFMMRNSKNPKFSMLSHPENLLTYYIDRAKRNFEDEIIQLTKYNPAQENAADYALKELYNLYKPAFISFGNEKRYDYGMFKAVIKHFIWHIKNKAIYGKNKEPIMLNISGEQGNGKTQFIRHLFKNILGNLYTETSMNVLNDEFGTNLLYESWLLFFDEMIRKNGELDVDKLKQVITSTEIKSREIFTSHYSTTFVRSSFIGAANNPVYEIIDDPTGMRRYINLEFTNDKIVHDKQLHPLLDLLWEQRGVAIWQSVDENLANGYLVDKYAQMMETAQLTYFSPNNTVYRFLKEECIEIVTKGTKDCVTNSLEDLYNNQYLEFCQKRDIMPAFRVSIEGFKKRIKQIYDGYHEVKSKIANLRFKAGSVSDQAPDPIKYILVDDYDVQKKTPNLVIPNSMDPYKEFVPEEIPEADIIIKRGAKPVQAKTETEAPQAQATPAAKFTIDEDGCKVFDSLEEALKNIQEGETIKINLEKFEEIFTTERQPSVAEQLGVYEMPSLEEILGEDATEAAPAENPEAAPAEPVVNEEKSEFEDEFNTLESKIHHIHQILGRTFSGRMKLANIGSSWVDGEFRTYSTNDPIYFTRQAILFHDELKSELDIDAPVEDIEKILKIQHEAINDFI